MQQGLFERSARLEQETFGVQGHQLVGRDVQPQFETVKYRLLQPRRGKFFNRHQAGEFLYEDMREVLREPAPDRQVLTAFQRVLMLGFCGRYRDANDPEREQLLSALNAQVAPLSLTQTLATCTRVGAVSPLSVLQSPVTQALMVGLLLVGGWWVLDHLLGEMVATLTGQA